MAKKYKKQDSEQATTKATPNIIVNKITSIAPNRQAKDVGSLKSAIINAESRIVPNRAQLYDLYNDVVSLDGRLSGLLEKRTAFVVNKSLKFVRDGIKVEELDELINSEKFNSLLSMLMDSVYWGCTGVEFIQGKTFDFVEIPRKHICVEKRMLLKNQYDTEGLPFDDIASVWVVGKPYDFGKLLKCSMYALFKRSGFGDFSQYVEIFGQPVRVIYYDSYDEQTKAELEEILNKSGSALAMMIPKQAQFEMLDGKTSNGNGELQTRLIASCNEEMSIAILGSTETTSSSSSSGYAQAEIHSAQQLEITRSDIKYITSLLNSDKFLAVLRSYGYPIDGGQFEFEKEVNLTELKTRLEIDERVATHVPIDADYWYQTYGINKPDNFEALMREKEEMRRAAQMALKKGSNGDKTGDDDADEEPDDTKTDKKQRKKLFATLSDFFGIAPLDGADSEW